MRRVLCVSSPQAAGISVHARILDSRQFLYLTDWLATTSEFNSTYKYTTSQKSITSPIDETQPNLINTAMAASQKQVVLITGCTDGGCGAALALAFHRRGPWQVIATARKVANMSSLPSEIHKVALDITDQASIEECVKTVRELTGGRMNVLINNAGLDQLGPLFDLGTDLTQVRKIFEVNCFSHVAVNNAFLPLLFESAARNKANPGDKETAVIVNHTSTAAHLPTPMPLHGLYCASKRAAAELTDTLRAEVKPFGIEVVELVSGLIKTPFMAKMGPNGMSETVSKGSRWEAARPGLEQLRDGKLHESDGIEVGVWAEGVVADVLGGGKTQVWRGGKAGLAWLGSALHLPGWMFTGMIHQMTGMNLVERELARGGK